MRLKIIIEKLIFARASKVITLTEEGRGEILQYHFGGPVEVIPNGVDIRQFSPDTSMVKDIDILFCGRIEKDKGSRSMVKVCQLLTMQRPDVKIAIVGYGEDEEYVRRALASLSPNVSIVGKLPFTKVKEYYSRSKIFVSTSYYEGLPGTCLEAMAMGLPVAVWDLSFYKELVIEGITGVFAPVDNFEVMVEKLNDVLSDHRKMNEIGARARNLATEKYDWAALAERLAFAYRI